MSKIYIICNRHDESLLSLYQEALYIGYEVVPFYHKAYDDSFNELYSKVTEDDYVMVLHTSFGSNLLCNIVEKIKCKKFLNSGAFKSSSIGDKSFQQKQILELDPSIIIPTYTKQEITALEFNSPIIAKPVDGSCGSGIILLLPEHKSLIEKAPDNYIFQPYVLNNGDWRVVVVGGKAISAIKRLGRIGQATNNIATGSFAIKETNSEILEKIYPIAESIAEHLHFDYVGIDIIQHFNTGKYYFLESNERPTFETSQILTGINIAQKIIEEIIS